MLKNQNNLITTYSSSHQNGTNQLIHLFCVPIIFFTVVATVYFYLPIALTALIIVATLVFYYRSLREFLPPMIVLYVISLCISAYFAPYKYFIQTVGALFVVAWIGQFWGHKIEGKKPSFFQDLFFLLVGPAWVMAKLQKKIFGS
jgi:uncharacterized membrane protein YGL010W